MRDEAPDLGRDLTADNPRPSGAGVTARRIERRNRRRQVGDHLVVLLERGDRGPLEVLLVERHQGEAHLAALGSELAGVDDDRAKPAARRYGRVKELIADVPLVVGRLELDPLLEKREVGTDLVLGQGFWPDGSIADRARYDDPLLAAD